MNGPTGQWLLWRKVKSVVSAPQNIVKVPFPQKTVVSSMQMTDLSGRPTYLKDIHV